MQGITHRQWHRHGVPAVFLEARAVEPGQLHPVLLIHGLGRKRFFLIGNALETSQSALNNWRQGLLPRSVSKSGSGCSEPPNS